MLNDDLDLAGWVPPTHTSCSLMHLWHQVLLTFCPFCLHHCIVILCNILIKISKMWFWVFFPLQVVCGVVQRAECWLYWHQTYLVHLSPVQPSPAQPSPAQTPLPGYMHDGSSPAQPSHWSPSSSRVLNLGSRVPTRPAQRTAALQSS